MPKKVDGRWVYDEEDEAQIALLEESNVRARKRLAREQKCEKGEHEDDGNKKCKHCGAAVEPVSPDPSTCNHEPDGKGQSVKCKLCGAKGRKHWGNGKYIWS